MTGCTTIIVKYRTYKALIRTQLEYASPVWDPHTQNLSHQLESVQRTAARYICSDFHSRTPGCVTDMFRSLEWESLQTRRKYARLILFYKISNNVIDIPVNEYISQNLTAVQEVNTNMFSHMRTKTLIWLKSTKSGPVGFEKIDFSHFSPCSMQWMFQTPGVSIVHVHKTVSYNTI